MRTLSIAINLLSVLLLQSCSEHLIQPGSSTPDSGLIDENVPTYSYLINKKYPHDPAAFTQGLVYEDGFFFEGTGLNGSSSLRKVNIQTGEVIQRVELDASFFGEGITVFDNKIYQLTWTSGKAFVYDRNTFERLATFSYKTQGWGLTHNGRQLIMSDGTNKLYFRQPNDFALLRELAVFDSRGPVNLLNELEYIDEKVFANVWQSNRIVVIDPSSGRVTNDIDLTGLLDNRNGADVLNGIAYDVKNTRLFVTGKFWPTIFEIQLIPQDSLANNGHKWVVY